MIDFIEELKIKVAEQGNGTSMNQVVRLVTDQMLSQLAEIETMVQEGEEPFIAIARIRQRIGAALTRKQI